MLNRLFVFNDVTFYWETFLFGLLIIIGANMMLPQSYQDRDI